MYIYICIYIYILSLFLFLPIFPHLFHHTIFPKFFIVPYKSHVHNNPPPHQKSIKKKLYIYIYIFFFAQLVFGVGRN